MPNDVETQVREVIEGELRDLVSLWAGAAADEHNVFLLAISPALAGSSKLTRQLTSRLGGKLARISRGVARVTYGEKVVPLVVKKADVDHVPPRHNSNDTFVWSDYDKALVVEQALRLVTFAGLGIANRIGGSEFHAAYMNAIDQLEGAVRSPDPWTVQVDLVVLDTSVGLVELESGGNLDSSNAIGQSRKLIQAGLALGDRDLPLHFAVAYANRGAGKRIQGSLPRYFTDSGEEGDGLLVGRSWWERVLPEGVSYQSFVGLFREVALEYQIGS